MTTEQRQRLLAIIAISAVAILAADKLLLTPLLEGWKERSNRIAELKESLQKSEVLIQRQDFIQERWKEMKSGTLPKDISAAENEVFKAFDRWSQSSRVSISSIKPQWKRNDEDSLVLECRADAFGPMEAVARFLYQLETDPLALKIDTVEIGSRTEDGQQLGFALQVSALMFPGGQP